LTNHEIKKLTKNEIYKHEVPKRHQLEIVTAGGVKLAKLIASMNITARFLII